MRCNNQSLQTANSSSFPINLLFEEIWDAFCAIPLHPTSTVRKFFGGVKGQRRSCKRDVPQYSLFCQTKSSVRSNNLLKSFSASVYFPTNIYLHIKFRIYRVTPKSLRQEKEMIARNHLDTQQVYRNSILHFVAKILLRYIRETKFPTVGIPIKILAIFRF